MTTINLIHSAGSASLAARIQAELAAQGHSVSNTVLPGSEPITVLLVERNPETAVSRALMTALENHQHVLPILAQEDAPLPSLIDHLMPLDFSHEVDGEALLVSIAELSGADAPRPLVVNTDALRKANRQVAYLLLGAIVISFVVAVIGVMAGILIPPTDEFAGVETQIYLTRNWYIDDSLPQGTAEAAAFEVTLENAIEGTVKPFLELTATGIAAFSESTHYPRSTADAADFPLTLTRVSTHVQERMAATVTQLAATAAAVTPTPSPASDE